MQKAFCIVAFQPKGEPLSKAAAALGPLVQAAKAARVTGTFEGKPVTEVFVLASTAVAPVVHYRCTAAAAASPAPSAPAGAPDGDPDALVKSRKNKGKE